MERIQIALEKARARRAGASAVDPAHMVQPAMGAQAATATAVVSPAPTPVPPTAQPQAERLPTSVPQAIANPEVQERWKALPEFEPRHALMTRNRIIGFEGGREAGPVDMMRTRILQEMRKNSWRRLAVTSPNQGCGKTTTCLNIAFSLGRQSNQRTVLADLDMRRPGLAKMLGMKTPHDFPSVITGKARAAENLMRYGHNLAFGTVSGPARNPAEILHGSEIGPALAGIEADYAATMMIFDLPPMMNCDDMMAFAPHVDCVLLLAAAEGTKMDDLDRCERELASATNVLGVVLNKCRYMEPGYGYGYY